MNDNLLTNEEMSALLPDNDREESRDKKLQAVPYNFRRPDRLSKEQVRGLYLLHDTFAQNLSSNLPLFLRTICEVNLISVEQQPYSEYLKGLPDPTTLFKFAVDSLRGAFAIEFSPSIAFPTIDRMLGGEGKPSNEKRAATELELKILEGFLDVITQNYSEAWNPIAEFKTEALARETRPQMLQIVAPNEVVVTVIYQMQIGEVQGSMSICLPVGMIETVIDKFTQSSYTSTKTTPPEATFAFLQTLSMVRLPLEVHLENVFASVNDLMNLAVGDVIRSNHRVDKPVKISISRFEKYSGALANLEGKTVVQIKHEVEQKRAMAEA
jgi:flagellar motor switch protein FliM